MARMMGGITGKGGQNVAPLYKETMAPKAKISKLKPTIPEPELRPGGKYNPTKPKNTLDPMFNRKTK